MDILHKKLFSKMPNCVSSVVRTNNWQRIEKHENTPVNTVMYVSRNNQNQAKET